jgi:hypothetical protein
MDDANTELLAGIIIPSPRMAIVESVKQNPEGNQIHIPEALQTFNMSHRCTPTIHQTVASKLMTIVLVPVLL